MAKRKNPLKDLDAFLKQEASSLINPEAVKGQADAVQKDTSSEKEIKHAVASKEDIISELESLARKEGGQFRTTFYDIIRTTMENLELSSSEDKMLINTILYLNDKAGWKENIKHYWSK